MSSLRHFFLTLYHEASGGGSAKQWSIWIENDGLTVSREWGRVGGKLQQSSDTSKPNVFKDAYEVCSETYARLVREKREEGYRESLEQKDTSDPLNGLTKLFVPAKPIAKMKVEDLLAEYRAGKFYVQRKRDGQRHLCLITRAGEVKLYSRRMDDMTGNFPALVSSIRSLRLPAGTILDGEIIIDRNGTDDFRAVGTITRAKAAKGAKQEANLPVRYMVFDVLYWQGEAIWTKPYVTRYNHLIGWMDIETGIIFRPRFLNIASGTFGDLQYWMDHAKQSGWEGLVCWYIDQPTQVMSGGKPKRCGCVKWKPKKERDFVATGYYLGSGNMSDVVGGLNIGEYLPGGTFRSCGNVGGFKGDSSIRREALTWDYPCVVSVEFDKQEPEGKLRFPVVLKLHEDKLPEECVAPEADEDDDE